MPFKENKTDITAIVARSFQWLTGLAAGIGLVYAATTVVPDFWHNKVEAVTRNHFMKTYHAPKDTTSARQVVYRP